MVMDIKYAVEEEKAISELRKRLINDLPANIAEDSHYIYKFLKARNFNLDQAESMLLKNVMWRKKHQMDTILTDFKPPEVCLEYMSQSLLGVSKCGCLVRYTALGNVDTKNLFRSANKYTILRTTLQVIETDVQEAKKISLKLGKIVTQGIVIIDFKHLTLLRATNKKTVELILAGANIFQDNYPERIHSIYIINASFYFTLGFEAIKNVLAKSVLSKIQVFGQEGYQEALLKIIDADVLPAFLGGTKTDPDGNPYCKSMLKLGGIIPKSYYMGKLHLSEQPGSQYIGVDRNSVSVVEVQVPNPGSILQWKFQTKCYDIGFGLSLGGVRLVPVHRLETEIEPECGMYRCETSGVYSFIFDNTYSWVHSKEVYYTTKVIHQAKVNKSENQCNIELKTTI